MPLLAQDSAVNNYFYRMKYLFVSTLLLLFFPFCKSKSTDTTSKPGITDSAAGGYLPIPELIKEDINRVDSFAGGILLRKSKDGKKDSSFIPLSVFKELAGIFLDPGFDSASFAQSFSETSLMDETTQQMNFIYTANRDSGSIRKAIVYVQPNQAVNQISRIYIEKSFASGDTLVEQKLTWKMNAYFMVATLRTVRDKPLPLEIQKVIWNPSLFAEE